MAERTFSAKIFSRCSSFNKCFTLRYRIWVSLSINSICWSWRRTSELCKHILNIINPTLEIFVSRINIRVRNVIFSIFVVNFYEIFSTSNNNISCRITYIWCIYFFFVTVTCFAFILDSTNYILRIFSNFNTYIR